MSDRRGHNGDGSGHRGGYRGGGRGGRGGGRGGRGGLGGFNRRDTHEDEFQQLVAVNRPQKKPMSEEMRAQFLNFQHELDFRHDKHERLVKCSRDITIESKRAIFLLHRVISAWLSPDDAESILREGENRLAAIRIDHWSRIGQELDGEDPFQFLRAYSPGLQVGVGS